MQLLTLHWHLCIYHVRDCSLVAPLPIKKEKMKE
jgi:hypothetical protein